MKLLPNTKYVQKKQNKFIMKMFRKLEIKWGPELARMYLMMTEDS